MPKRSTHRRPLTREWSRRWTRPRPTPRGSALVVVLLGLLGLLAALTPALPSASAGAVSAGVTSPAPAPAPAAVAEPGSFHAVPPVRALDTRRALGIATTTPVAGGSTTPVRVLGLGGVPASGVVAASVTLTVTTPTGQGVLTAYASGGQRPGVSNLNWVAGQTVANAAMVRLGADGRLALWVNASGTVHLVVDVTGYYTSGAATAPGTTTFVTPTRLLDTRATGFVSGRTQLLVGGRAGVPLGGASAAVLTITVTQPTQPGHLEVRSTQGADAQVRVPGSSVNWTTGQTVANLVLAPLGADGTVHIELVSPGALHLVVDVSGWVHQGSLTAAGAVHAVLPDRVMDTRSQPHGSAGTTPLAPGASVVIDPWKGQAVRGSNVSAVVVNLTVTDTAASGYLTAYGSGARPNASSLNWAPHQVVADLAVVPLGPDGRFTVTSTSAGTTHLVVDVMGTVLTQPVTQATGWSAAPLTLPSGTLATGSTYARAAACSTSRTCAVAATYLDPTGRYAADVVARYDAGTWTSQRLNTNRVGPLVCSGALCATVDGAFATLSTGGAWTTTVLPGGGGGDAPAVRSLSCPDDQHCFAAGQLTSNGTTSLGGYVAAWTSGSWSVTLGPVLPLGAGAATFTSIACRSASACVVVGYSSSRSGTTTTTRPLVETWDGTSWRVEVVPTPSPDAQLGSVRCTADSCLVRGTSPQPFLVSQDAGGWHLLGHSVPADSLMGCGSADCATAGSISAPGVVTLGAVDGTSATPGLVTVAPGARPTDTVQSLGCAPDGTCVAAGRGTSGISDRGWVAERTGSTWALAAAPGFVGAVESDLPFLTSVAVACADHTLCVGLRDQLGATGARAPVLLQRGTLAPPAPTTSGPRAPR